MTCAGRSAGAFQNAPIGGCNSHDTRSGYNLGGRMTRLNGQCARCPMYNSCTSSIDTVGSAKASLTLFRLGFAVALVELQPWRG